jgi:hypothetical protein
MQERLHVVWQELVNSGQLTPSDFVRVTSTAAAQIFNIYPRKGVVSLATSEAAQLLSGACCTVVLACWPAGLWHAACGLRWGSALPARACRHTSKLVWFADYFTYPALLVQVAEGSDADVIIFDPSAEHTLGAATHHSAMDTNIYEGYRVTGKVREWWVLSGELVLDVLVCGSTPAVACWLRLLPALVYNLNQAALCSACRW